MDGGLQLVFWSFTFGINFFVIFLFYHEGNPYFQTPFKLADPTKLQLIGVGVDFVFPCHKKEAFIRGNDHKCLKFGSCVVVVWRVSGGCLVGV